MSSKRVAIIGAGIGGITACRYALENGLEPVVFEKADSIGGLWGANSTAVWDGLRINVTYYTDMISDFPWPKDTVMFPTGKQVHEYFVSYCNHFGLNKYFNLKHKVESVKQMEDKKWKVDVVNLETSENKSQVFDFLIVASGRHSVPRMPKFENSENFKGLQIHSSKFILNDPRLKDKNVIVVGCSISGAEITASLVGHAKRVVNIFPRPYLMMSRLVKYKMNDDTYKIWPMDFFSYRRCFTYPKQGQTPEDLYKYKLSVFKSIFPEQTNKNVSHPDLYVDLDDPKQEVLVALSDKYYPYVKQNKIIPKKTRIKKFQTDGVHLEDGTFEQVDAVIYATGYDLSVDFFEDHILKTLSYDLEKNYKHAIMLYKCTFHPDISNMAIVGQHDGLFFTGNELQSMWVTKVFSGKLSLPDRSIMIDFIAKECAKRDSGRRVQYPYGVHVSICDGIASEIDLLPDLNDIKEKQPDLYEMFDKNMIFSTQYIYKRNPELALRLMNEIDSLYKKSYTFGTDDVYAISLEDVTSSFGKYYPLPNDIFEMGN